MSRDVQTFDWYSKIISESALNLFMKFKSTLMEKILRADMSNEWCWNWHTASVKQYVDKL